MAIDFQCIIKQYSYAMGFDFSEEKNQLLLEGKMTVPLDQEEQELLDALEQLDAKALPPVPHERQQLFREAAASFVSRETSMSIRCQSFVKDILHKYLTGQLLEKNAC